jgi:hypothetical protein
MKVSPQQKAVSNLIGPAIFDVLHVSRLKNRTRTLSTNLTIRMPREFDEFLLELLLGTADPLDQVSLTSGCPTLDLDVARDSVTLVLIGLIPHPDRDGAFQTLRDQYAHKPPVNALVGYKTRMFVLPIVQADLVHASLVVVFNPRAVFGWPLATFTTPPKLHCLQPLDALRAQRTQVKSEIFQRIAPIYCHMQDWQQVSHFLSQHHGENHIPIAPKPLAANVQIVPGTAASSIIQLAQQHEARCRHMALTCGGFL